MHVHAHILCVLIPLPTHTSLRLMGSSHLQRTDVQAVSLSILTAVTTAYNIAAMCEHASPAPAMQLQSAHSMVPFDLRPTHGNKGGLFIF